MDGIDETCQRYAVSETRSKLKPEAQREIEVRLKLSVADIYIAHVVRGDWVSWLPKALGLASGIC